MNRPSRYGALALAWTCALGCTSDEERSLDAGSEHEAGPITLLDSGGLDAGDGAVVPAECVPLLALRGSEIRSHFAAQKSPWLPYLELAHPTSKITLHANLSADASVGAAFDPRTPATTSQYSVPVDVFDSLAGTHRLTLFFLRIDDDRWEWHAMVDGASVLEGEPATAVERASGVLSFEGGLLAAQETIRDSDWDFRDAVPSSIAFDFGPTRDDDAGVPVTTQRPGPFSTTFLQQNGSSFGQLERLEIAPDGTVTGVFADGSRRAISYCEHRPPPSSP